MAAKLAGPGGGGDNESIHEINVTPFVDVMLEAWKSAMAGHRIRKQSPIIRWHLNDRAVSDGARLASAGRSRGASIFYNRRRGGRI